MPKELIIFLLAKEFRWLPSQIQAESAKDMKAIMHILSVYNSVKNAEIDKMNKARSSTGGRSGGRSKGFQGGKYIRRETVGPGGINVEDIPI